MMIHYINLDEEVSRRTTLEANFAATRSVDLSWELVRFPAISAKDNQVNTLQGSRSNQEKACMLSHYGALMKACESDEFSWIVEDDVLFSPAAFKTVYDFVTRFKDADWDILFTDVDIRKTSDMVDFFSAKRKIVGENIESMNLMKYKFSSAASYIINPKRKEKILALLKPPPSIDYLWDLYISLCVNEERLIAFVTLPFVTSLSKHASSSQIQKPESEITELLFHAFRKLMHVSADVNEVKQMLSKIDNNYFDDASYCIGKIVSGFETKNLFVK